MTICKQNRKGATSKKCTMKYILAPKSRRFIIACGGYSGSLEHLTGSIQRCCFVVGPQGAELDTQNTNESYDYIFI